MSNTIEVSKALSTSTSTRTTPIDYPKDPADYTGNEASTSRAATERVETQIRHHDVHSKETADTDADAPTSLRLRGHGSTRASNRTVSNITATPNNTTTQPSPYPNPHKTLSAFNKSPQLQESSLEPIDICFTASIFAPTTKTADLPNDFTNFTMEMPTSFQFFLYTNLEDLESPGWTKVLRKFNYRRFITQSRWGKFMAWKDPEMKACQTIFYFDGHFEPSKLTYLAKLAKKIKESKFGLAQKLHKQSKRRSAIAEFDAVLKLKKDIKKNVNASIEWLQAQPDFYNNCTLYENAYFGKSITRVLIFICCCASAYPTAFVLLFHTGYDPTNVHFQKAAEYFWSRYSMEEDSWRDQPLWCHTIERSHIKPIIIEGYPFSPNRERQGHKNHEYGAAQDNDAAVKAEVVPSARNGSEEARGDVLPAVNFVGANRRTR
jgi:hypothetical protein